MARTWWSVRLELVGGRGEYFWPRPGRVLAASRSHSFRQLADAIDTGEGWRGPPDPSLGDLPPLLQW